MSHPAHIPVRVANIETVTPFVKTFTFEPTNGVTLPRFSAGSHVVVTMPGADRTYRNPYSLMSSPFEPDYYQVSVRREDEGRGGSLYMHEQVSIGDELDISAPTNLFALDSQARRHLLIAGGIGITPFLAQLHELERMQADYQLHYAFRNQDNAAFHDYLQDNYSDRLQCYASDNGVTINPARLLADQPLGTHLYVCGPKGLLEAVTDTARRLGWPESCIHYEEFAAPPVGKPFTVELAKSGRSLEVAGSSTILETLEQAGLEPNCLCRGGVCGECETVVLDGDIDHNDHVLSDEVKASNERIMICVSRARSERLVLDL